MKKIHAFFPLFLIASFSLAQQPPVNDTLIPKQHRDDTIQYEPKLEGGALIDTINTRDHELHHPAFVRDTLNRRDSIKYKDQPKKK